MSGLEDLHRRAHTQWCRKRRRLIAMGQWQPFTDAAPVREHVRELQKAGMPASALTKRLDLPDTALEHLMWKRDGEFSKLVRRETADVLMGYWPELADFPARSLIDATGSRRRIRALMLLGWTQRALAERLGVSERSLNRALVKEHVTADLARRIAAQYDSLWRRSPYPAEVHPEAAKRTSGYARNRGWYGPLAWDDDTIDEPQATPQVDAPQPEASEGVNLVDRWLMGESVILDAVDRRKAMVHLFEWSELPSAEIAARLEMTESAASRAWERHKEKARKAGEPVPWRRRWAVRNKELTKNEMGAAA